MLDHSGDGERHMGHGPSAAPQLGEPESEQGTGTGSQAQKSL